MRPLVLAVAIAAFLAFASSDLNRQAAFSQSINGYDMCFDAIGTPVPAVPTTMNTIALASIQNGRPVVLYNTQLVGQMNKTMQLMVFAHECGHHALGHIIGMSLLHSPDNVILEQEADCYGIIQLFNNGIIDNAGVTLIQQTLSTWIGDQSHFPGPVRAVNLRGCLAMSSPITASAAKSAGAGGDPDAMLAKAPNDAEADECLVPDSSSPLQVTWNENGSPPVVTYRAPLKNSCDVAVRCKIAVVTGTVPSQNAAGDRTGWKPFAGEARSFTIPSETSKSMAGTLVWHRESVDVKPRLRFGSSRDVDYIRCKMLASTSFTGNGVAALRTTSVVAKPSGFAVFVANLLDDETNENGPSAPRPASSATLPLAEILPRLESSIASDFSVLKSHFREDDGTDEDSESYRAQIQMRDFATADRPKPCSVDRNFAVWEYECSKVFHGEDAASEASQMEDNLEASLHIQLPDYHFRKGKTSLDGDLGTLLVVKPGGAPGKPSPISYVVSVLDRHGKHKPNIAVTFEAEATPAIPILQSTSDLDELSNRQTRARGPWALGRTTV